MEIINITKARSNLFHLVSDVIHGEPKCIKTREGNAIVISQADWEGAQETLYLMLNTDFGELLDRAKTPLSDCVEELNW